MRLACLSLALILVAAFVSAPHAEAQPVNAHNTALYAHSDANALTLTALPPAGFQRSAEARSVITFKLSPVLGASLRIYGAITVTVYLRASAPLFGTVFAQVSELMSSGNQVPVTGARIDSSTSLEVRPIPFILAVGPIDYQFQRGSAIQLHVQVITSSSATPFLDWDDSRTPTNLKLPVVDPLQAQVTICDGPGNCGKVFPANPDEHSANLNLSANVTDALGAYRLTDSSLVFAGADGTSNQIQLKATTISRYALLYSYTTALGIGPWRVTLRLLDGSGNSYSFEDQIWVAPFHAVRINIVDSENRPLTEAKVNVTFRQQSWSNQTNSTGWTTVTLPSSDIVGSLIVTVTWHNAQTRPMNVTTLGDLLKITMPVYDFGIEVNMEGIPLPFTIVKLLQDGRIVNETSTQVDGIANFKRIPEGIYTVQIQYLFNQFQAEFTVNDSRVTRITVPIPVRTEILLIAVGAVAASGLTIFVRRRSKFYPRTYSYFNELTVGGLPRTCFVVIAGNSGSGRSVLLQTLAAEHLIEGQSCVYVINTEYPSKVRENMMTLGMPIQKLVDARKLLFIDLYSAVGGTPSTEEFSVTSHTDLTSVGMKISKCLEELGPGTDVYVDSISPMLTALRLDYLLNFLQSIAAKVKANDGKLCVTVGTGIEKSDVTKLEENSDCVIETQLQESKRGQKRRLRVKKLRGKSYMDKWATFRIENGKGIVFLTRTKPKGRET